MHLSKIFVSAALLMMASTLNAQPITKDIQDAYGGVLDNLQHSLPAQPFTRHLELIERLRQSTDTEGVRVVKAAVEAANTEYGREYARLAPYATCLQHAKDTEDCTPPSPAGPGRAPLQLSLASETTWRYLTTTWFNLELGPALRAKQQAFDARLEMAKTNQNVQYVAEASALTWRARADVGDLYFWQAGLADLRESLSRPLVELPDSERLRLIEQARALSQQMDAAYPVSLSLISCVYATTTADGLASCRGAYSAEVIKLNKNSWRQAIQLSKGHKVALRRIFGERPAGAVLSFIPPSNQ